MSSLQDRRRSSPAGAWKVSNNDLAIKEILCDRKEAIESGKVKGRRLFDLPAPESTRWSQDIHEISEVRSVCSYDSDDEKEYTVEIKEELTLYPFNSCSSLVSLSSSSSSPSYIDDDCMEKEIVAEEGGTAAVEVEAVEASDGGKKRNGNGFKGWLAIGLMLAYAISIYAGWRSRDEHMVNLIPT